MSTTDLASLSEMGHIFLMNSGVAPFFLFTSKADISDWQSSSKSSNVVTNSGSVHVSLILVSPNAALIFPCRVLFNKSSAKLFALWFGRDLLS